MAKLNKKYVEDFETLVRDWERFLLKPDEISLDLVNQDLAEIEYDLGHMKFQ